jgi:hypothetical protein
MSMSYRRKKLLALFCATALSMTAVAGCTGTKSSTGNVVSSETETNAEETSAQSEAGTFSSADMFTERDLAGTYEESGAVYVTLSDDGITGETDGVVIDGQMVTITAEGTYIFSGTLSEGQIVVDADNAKVQIVFDNVDITCASSAAVYVKSAEKVFVTLAEGSQNTLRNTDEYVAIDDNNIDAVIFAKSDLTLNGTGSLTIISAEGHGIVSKDDLKITGGTYDITAAGHALSGKDSVRIADGTFILTAEKDGIHAENADDEVDSLAILAELKKGKEVDVINYETKEAQTNPPTRYNSGSMILAMENAGKLIEDEELREQIKGAGIGTSATRAEIMKKLERIQYIQINDKTQIITPTQKGEIIYDIVNNSMPDMLNPKLTASWEKGLDMVAKKEIQSDEFMGKLEKYIHSKFNRLVVKY